jgi:hypothetical protein
VPDGTEKKSDTYAASGQQENYYPAVQSAQSWLSTVKLAGAGIAGNCILFLAVPVRF